MKTIIERVIGAQVTIRGSAIANIQNGYLILAGFTHTDTEQTVQRMAEKIINLRIMADENNKMNKTISETGGSILVVSQFTLYADTSGRRPGFQNSAKTEQATTLFDLFIKQLKLSQLNVQQGIFGEYMAVQSNNDGPLTLILDT